MTKQEIINAVFNRNVYTNEFKLNNLLDNLIKSELLIFHEWLSDENNDAYSEILVDEYLSQKQKSFCECGQQKHDDSKYCTSCNKFHSV